MDQFEVVVSKAEALTPRIREFVLARANGAPMPGWAAGAHIDVHLPDVGRRSYSLIETASPRAAAEHPTAYRIAVLQESKGRGGSSFMHGLKTGDRLTISPPANNFPLRAGASEVAGGLQDSTLAQVALGVAVSSAEARPHDDPAGHCHQRRRDERSDDAENDFPQAVECEVVAHGFRGCRSSESRRYRLS